MAGVKVVNPVVGSEVDRRDACVVTLVDLLLPDDVVDTLDVDGDEEVEILSENEDGDDKVSGESEVDG